MPVAQSTSQNDASNSALAATWQWLHQRPNRRQWLLVVFAAVLFQLVWSGISIWLVASLDGPQQKAHPVMRWLMLEAPLWKALAVLAVGVMIEEVMFRLVPLGLALGFYGDDTRHGWLVVAMIAVASVAFGFFHGLEWYRLLLQSVGGVVLSVVYLKACGMDASYWLRALGTAWFAHLVFNTTVLVAIRLMQSAA
jgi:hypothetical protein